MDFKSHFAVAVGCFVALWLFFPSQVYWFLLPIPIITNWIPDADFKFDSHRNWVLHSILLPMITHIPLLLIASIPILGMLTALIVFSFGLHCLCDLSLRAKGGSYGIKWFRNKSIDGFRFANFWLTLNFLLSVIILYYQLFVAVM